MWKAIAGWRPVATGLLCAFILVASLDRTPDPPAVKPFGGGAKTRCLDNHNDGFCDPHRLSLRAASAPAFAVDWFASGRIHETSHPIHCVTLLRQASDSSPPHLPALA